MWKQQAAPVTVLVFATVIAIAAMAACNLGEINLNGPITGVNVYVKNSTSAPFAFWSTAGGGSPVSVGESRFLSTLKDGYMDPRSFDIWRGENRVASVTYRLLQVPFSDHVQNSTLAVTEPGPGVFAATSLDRDWIQVMSVQNF